MNSSILHITNGDITTSYLQKLDFSGEFITWREMLCEGKTTTDVGSEHFWKNRFEFLKSSYKISKKRFIDYTLKEYRNLCNKKNQEEIVLWFDHDLFCQINMIAVISWLKRYRKGYCISLVSNNKIKKLNKTLNLSELSQAELTNQYKNRIELSIDDIEYADYIWQLYCSDSPLRLETVYSFNSASPFMYLTTALESHIQRFPSVENGLNKAENTILRTVANHQLKTKGQLVNKLIEEQEVYGFGDIQYSYKINKLSNLFVSFNPVVLNKKGKQILKNQHNFYRQMCNDVSYLGGARKYSFLYHNASKKLLQITS